MYLVHAWAKSRAGFNGVLSVRRLTPDGRAVVGEETRDLRRRHAPPDDRGPEVLQARRLVLRVRAGGRRGGRLADGPALAERARAVRGPHRARPGRHRHERPAPGRVGGDGARRLVPALPGPRRVRPHRAPAAAALARRLARHRPRRGRRRPGRAGAGRAEAASRAGPRASRRRATRSTTTAWACSGSGRRTRARSGRRSRARRGFLRLAGREHARTEPLDVAAPAAPEAPGAGVRGHDARSMPRDSAPASARGSS